jgi:hypothetical protein
MTTIYYTIPLLSPYTKNDTLWSRVYEDALKEYWFRVDKIRVWCGEEAKYRNSDAPSHGSQIMKQ